ncbi:hypothetical protein OTU49_016587, partial [Cherax quadricarinatus]
TVSSSQMAAPSPAAWPPVKSASAMVGTSPACPGPAHMSPVPTLPLLTAAHDAKCPAVQCSHPRVVNCCASCSVGCRFQNLLLEEGDTLDSPTYTCHTCVCQRGSVSCSPKTCPALPCPTHQQEPGECCPSCSSEGQCVYQGQVLLHGASYTDNTTCTHCTCQDGEMRCQALSCPSPNCSHPEPTPGTDCC